MRGSEFSNIGQDNYISCFVIVTNPRRISDETWSIQVLFKSIWTMKREL